MLGRTNTGSGGLNFTVVGGTTAPSNPQENIIWVNTSTKITSYIFSATQPTGSAGMVWIPTGTSSTVEFNALKKNGIQVYPLSAKQYIGGAWVDKTAKSYQGGAWVEWRTYLYNKGNQCTNITGGWKQTIATNGSVTFNSDSIKVSIHNNTNGNTFVGAGKAIDLTEYNTLNVNVVDFYIQSSSVINLYIKTAPIVDASAPVAGLAFNKKGVISLDISGLTGSYYIGVGGGWFYPCNATFSEVWLT